MKSYKGLVGTQVFLSTDNKLIEIKLNKETITSDVYTYEYTHNNEDYELSIGRNNEKFECLFYQSEHCYRNNAPYSPTDWHFLALGNNVRLNEEGNMVASLYVFENNKAVKKDVKVDKMISTPCTEVVLADNIEAYANVAECYAWNKVQAANINGEQVYSPTGYMRDYATFSDEQKKSIEKLRKAIEEVSKTCTFLCSDDGLYVMNGKHKISDCEWAECRGDELTELPAYQKSFIKLPHIERNYMETPCVLRDEQA